MEVRGVEVQIRGDKSVLCCLEGSVSAHQHVTCDNIFYPYFF